MSEGRAEKTAQKPYMGFCRLMKHSNHEATLARCATTSCFLIEKVRSHYKTRFY